MRRIYAFILVMACAVATWAQEKYVITGFVSDGEFQGEPLVGATIVAGNPQDGIGAVTDNEGKYTLEIPSATKTLEVSYMVINLLYIFPSLNSV